MSDYSDKNKVVQANNLIQKTNWEMNETTLKLFKLVISCIDTKNPPKDNKITITKKEIYDFIGFKSDTNYSYVKQQMKILQKQIVQIETEQHYMFISVVPKVKWERETDTVECYFDDDLMPYLVELNKCFLQYDVMNLKQINSKYGLILYEYLLSKHREESKKSRFGQYKYRIEMDKLRWITGTQETYSRFTHFEDRVLKTAKKDINCANLEFLMDYSKVKVGRRITAIDFKIRKRTSYKETEFDDVAKPEWLTREI